MTTVLDHLAVIGDKEMATSATVAERYRKFVAPYVAHPAQFVKVAPVDVEADTERRAEELAVMRSRGEL